MSILVTLIIVIIIAGLIWWLVDMLPIPANFKMIIRVIMILIAIIYLCNLLGVFGGVRLR